MLCRQFATPHYYHDYIINKYIYKGHELEKETRHLLCDKNDFCKEIDDYLHNNPSSNEVTIKINDHGQFALMLALVHPEIEIHAYTPDSDTVALMEAMQPFPQNLHIHEQ